MLKFIKSLFSSNKKSLQIKVTAELVVNNTINPAREMLKEATALKKEKKYDEACEKLKEAFSADGSDELMVKERMRLPMYLQLTKKNDEGWRILNELNVKYTDVFSQAEIANQMRVFLQKEKKYTQAIIFSVWGICKEVVRDRYNIQGSIDLADQLASTEQEFGFLSEQSNEKVYGKTPKGNPITDSAYKMFIDRIEDNISVQGVSERILPLLKKDKKLDLVEAIAVPVSEYLKSTDVYDLRAVRDILNKNLSENEAAV